MLENYLPVLVFLAVGLIVGVLMMGIGFVLGTRKPDREKNSPYDAASRPSKTPV
jgi:NADH-quinone oxidoreductase subunit A